METGTIWFVVSPAAPLQTTSTATSDCQHGSDICLVCLRFWMLSILNALLRATSHFHDGLDFSFLGQCGVRSADTDLYAAALFSKGFHVVATTNLATPERTRQKRNAPAEVFQDLANRDSVPGEVCMEKQDRFHANRRDCVRRTMLVDKIPKGYSVQCRVKFCMCPCENPQVNKKGSW